MYGHRKWSSNEATVKQKNDPDNDEKHGLKLECTGDRGYGRVFGERWIKKMAPCCQ